MSETDKPRVNFGALPPPRALHKAGDRADKLCVEAATEVLAQRMVCLVLFKDVEAAIDAYMASAAKHGWKLS